MKEIFFESPSPDSKRMVIFEDNGTSAWLYLASAANYDVEKDAFVYSPLEPRAELNREGINQGEPPILISEYASDTAVIQIEDENELSILWSENGRNVAVFHNEEVIAAIYEDEKRGYSKALSKKSGFGKPWSEEKYQKYFPEPSGDFF